MTVHPAVPETPLPEWSLDDLYGGRDDPRVEADIAAARDVVSELGRSEGALLGARAEPERLGRRLAETIALYERGADLMGAVAAFAGLQSATAQDDPQAAKFEADVRTRLTAIGADTLWFTLELNQLDDAELEAALDAAPEAARWRPWLRRVRLQRPHELSADLERLLVDRAPATSNWVRLFDETLARMKIQAGEEAGLTLAEALNRLSDPSPERRRTAAEGLAVALEKDAPVLALSLNTLAFEKQVEDRWRKFTTPAQSRHLANEVHAESVDALEAAVVDAYPRLSHRYYALKAKALGKPTLDYWDRNAPLTEAPARRYDWAEAKAIVLDSYNALSPGFAATARAFLDRSWTDARPKPGKTSGAFSHPVTADRHPYVLLNYMGERRDVLTLAHELGHAVHQTLAAKQGTLLADTPLTLAETASIFGEGLVFERLLAEASPEDRRALLAGRIEDGLNTVVRQISFHRFESRFHAMRAEGEVSAEALGRLWLEVMGESLGPAVTLNAGYEHYWAYVSHFAHAPFYVYAYAFGDLLVSALMERRRADPGASRRSTRSCSRPAGRGPMSRRWRPFGLDPRDKSFWAQGCARLERLIEEFEALG
jgi:oligoendopeptidase F